MISQIIPGIIRTVVPYVVGLVVSVFVTIGVDFPESAVGDITGILTLVIGSAYYAVSMWLQEKFPGNAFVAYLLGSPAKPVYKEQD